MVVVAEEAVAIIFRPSLVTVTLNDMFISKCGKLQGISLYIGRKMHLYSDANKESAPVNIFFVTSVRSNIHIITLMSFGILERLNNKLERNLVTCLCFPLVKNIFLYRAVSPRQ